MARRGIKKQDHEKLDNGTISTVIGLLRSEKPITKKEACEILNISYNTKRLSLIIEDYEKRIAYENERRRRNRGKAFSDFEIKDIVLSYLKGESIAEIAKSLYRTTDGVKQVLKDFHIPERARHSDYQHPDLIPDESLSEDYKPGEFAWSAKYNCVVEIKKLVETHSVHGNVYRIWIHGKYNQFGLQPWYELGKLPFLEGLNIKSDEFSTTDQLTILNRITD